jgi:4-aminobutyrate aminotransferase-like enzyme
MACVSNNTKAILDLLRAYESRNVTFIEANGSWPIVWRRARGVYVWDVDGQKYLDLTAAFGVAAAGHANPRVVKAGQQQMARLLHAMGDVHPHPLKAQLARELSRITFERWTAAGNVTSSEKQTTGKVIFCNSGFEAVEAALKTAMLATGRRGVVAFEQAYHGTGYGALNATHREHFRGPFRPQLAGFGYFVRFPKRRDELAAIEGRIHRQFQRREVGAILVEPVQVRGGINIPPPEFLPLLRKIADEYSALLILDEIYTGFGRTGRWFAAEHSGTVPDLICLGKALTGGFPLSACVGRAEVMDLWPKSRGEALHTSTFLGHPVGCAMALAHIAEIKRQQLPGRAERLGLILLARLSALDPRSSTFRLISRGIGLLAGLEFRRANGLPATAMTLHLIKRMLERGYLLLPEGEHANVISFTPPLTVSEGQLCRAVEILAELIRASTQR